MTEEVTTPIIALALGVGSQPKQKEKMHERYHHLEKH